MELGRTSAVGTLNRAFNFNGLQSVIATLSAAAATVGKFALLQQKTLQPTQPSPSVSPTPATDGNTAGGTQVGQASSPPGGVNPGPLSAVQTLQQAQVNLKAAQDNLNTSTATGAQASQGLQQAQQGLKAAQDNLNASSAGGVTSIRDLRQAQEQLRRSLGTVAQAESSLTNAERQDATVTGNLAQAKARLATVEREVSASLAAQTQQARQNAAGWLTAATISFTAFEKIVSGARSAVASLEAYSNQVRTLQALTGASVSESAGVTSLLRGAGISDTQQIREVLRLTKDFQSVQGRAGLSRLGIAITPDQSGLALLNQIIDRLGEIPDGLRKATIEEEIFGARGAMSLQPLLRMSKESRDQLIALGGAFDGSALKAVQRFQEKAAILGATIESKIVLPVAEKLLPVFEKAVDTITLLADSFGNIDKNTGGLASALIVAVGLVGAFALASAGVLSLGKGLLELRKALQGVAAVDAFLTALQGPAGIAKVIGAVAVSGVAVYGLDKLLEHLNKDSEKDKDRKDPMADSAGKFRDAVDKFSQSADDWKRFSRGGTPDQLSPTDITALGRMQRLGAFA